MFIENHSVMKEYKLLMENGEKTEAFVVSKEHKRTREKYRSNPKLNMRSVHEYFLSIKFDTKTKKGHLKISDYLEDKKSQLDLKSNFVEVRDVPVTLSLYEAAYVGKNIDIIFLPESPKIVRILNNDGTITKPNTAIFAWIFFVVFLISVYLLYHYLKTGKNL